MFEVSNVRSEDYDLVRDKSGEFVDVLQCNNAASSRTPRGHQFPAAFLSWVLQIIFSLSIFLLSVCNKVGLESQSDIS